MLDKSFIGHVSKPRSVEVEKGQLKLFAKATGETNPIYFDEAAARAAGHPTLLAPPTFSLCLQSVAPGDDEALKLLGVGTGKRLHGEQRFSYVAPIYAGDTVVLTTKIIDIYEKKGGTLEFIVLETDAKNQKGETLSVARSTVVFRNG